MASSCRPALPRASPMRRVIRATPRGRPICPKIVRACVKWRAATRGWPRPQVGQAKVLQCGGLAPTVAFVALQRQGPGELLARFAVADAGEVGVAKLDPHPRLSPPVPAHRGRLQPDGVGVDPVPEMLTVDQQSPLRLAQLPDPPIQALIAGGPPRA